MLDRVTHHPWYKREQGEDQHSGVAVGRVSLELINTAAQPVVMADGKTLAVMDGELYDCAERRRELESAGCRFSGDSHAEILMHGYRCQGKQFFRKLSGKFAAALWDAANQRLILTNDRFGMQPLYYARLPGKFLAASEIKAVLADPSIPRQPSLRGLSQFLTYGQYLGDDTSFENIHVLPAAGWLVYDVAEDRLSVERYWCLEPSRDGGASEAELLDRLDHAFQHAVDCRVQGGQRLGISLSGGMDARTILAVIDHERVPVISVALGIEGCRDHRSATQLAALTNRRHHNYVLSSDFLANYETHLRRMVHLTDGQYLSQCIVMPTLPFYRELGIEVLLRGHAGELMHMGKAYNFSLDHRALAIRDEVELEAWAFRHLRAYMLEGVEGPLLANRRSEDLQILARDSLGECLRESAAISPQVQRLWHLFFTQRSRRETALAMVKFGSLVETRLPYLDNELVDLLMVTPPSRKLDETLQAHILRKRRPEFLKIINVNTGTRVEAGKIARRLAGLWQRGMSKLRVRGYQPYERLGLWLRRELRPVVERTLLTDRCLGRGLLHPDTVRSVVDQHFHVQRNHTFLIVAMVVIELGQQMLVDGDGFPLSG